MPEDKKTPYELVKAKIADNKPLFDRMDVDKNLYFSKLYEMMRPDMPNTKMDNVINVTFNDATTFGMRSIATMGGARRRTEVKGRNLPPKQATLIEGFTDDISYSVDGRLINRGIPSLDAFVDEQICIRGSTAARVTGRKVFRDIDGAKKAVFLPNVRPLDTRYFVYEATVDGIKWGAPFSWRSKSALMAEYEELIKKKGLDIGENGAELADYYDSEKNVIFIDGEKVKEQKNPFGYPPFVVAQAAAGSMLLDKDAYQHRGESIFWANRHLFPEINRTASIFQTLNVGSFAGAVQYESAAGTKAERPKRFAFGLYAAVPVEKGMGYKPMPVNDIKAAARLFYATLYTRVQQGGLSAIDYGNLTFPLSAVAIQRLTSSRDQIFIPRFQGKSEFYQQLFRMLIRQYQEAGVKTALGDEGFMAEYDPKDLKGYYQIRFKFSSESKEQQIANISVAQSARGLESDYTIRRKYLDVADPEAEDERVAAQQAEQMDEVLFLYTRATKLIAQKSYREARILANKMVMTILSRGGVPAVAALGPQRREAKPGGTQPIPLLGQGKAGETVAPEVGEEQAAVAQMGREEEATAAVGAEAKQEGVR